MARTANSIKTETHERIVNVAARAVRRQGYAGVGVAEVMREAGLSHGGFYAHFDSRESLLVEAIDRASRESADSLKLSVENNLQKDKSKFRSLIEAYLSHGHLISVDTGCPIAALAGEMPRQANALSTVSSNSVKRLIKAVENTLPKIHADQAEVVAAQLVGSLQLARALGDNDEARALLKTTRKTLLRQYDIVPTN